MRYIEAIMVVQKGISEGFIRGFFRGKGDNSLILNMESEEIVQESLKEKIDQILHPAEEIIHILIPEDKEGLLKESISAMKKEGFLCDLKSERRHSKIRAEFNIEIYNVQIGKEVKRIISEAKEVKISFEKKLEEILREEESKVELYAPVHSYELKGKGKIEGDIEPSIRLIQELRNFGVKFTKIAI